MKSRDASPGSSLLSWACFRLMYSNAPAAAFASQLLHWDWSSIGLMNLRRPTFADKSSVLPGLKALVLQLSVRQTERCKFFVPTLDSAPTPVGRQDLLQCHLHFLALFRRKVGNSLLEVGHPCLLHFWCKGWSARPHGDQKITSRCLRQILSQIFCHVGTRWQKEINNLTTGHTGF